MRRIAVCSLVISVLGAAPAAAQKPYIINRDHGGLVEAYKDRYARIRSSGQRVIVNGICNSACTLLLGMVPLNRVCVTPKASLGFHEAYVDKRWTFGVRVASTSGTADLMSYYPQPVKDWISRQGGLTPKMKHVRYGAALWKMIDPCPDEW